MKRIKKLVLVVLFCGMLLPLRVYADSYPVGISGYSVPSYAVVGSNLVLDMKGYVIDQNKVGLDGTLTYDDEVLEFVEIRVVDPTIFVEAATVPRGEINILSNKNGKLEYLYDIYADDAIELGVLGVGSEVEAEAIFKVKSKPSNNKTVITFNDKYDSIYVGDGLSYEFNIIDNEECDVKSETQDMTLMYVSWGLSGVLLLALIIVIIKRH